jgi:hypothetical protein
MSSFLCCIIHISIAAAGKESAIPPDVDSLNMWETISSKRKSPRDEIILNLGEINIENQIFIHSDILMYSRRLQLCTIVFTKD